MRKIDINSLLDAVLGVHMNRRTFLMVASVSMASVSGCLSDNGPSHDSSKELEPVTLLAEDSTFDSPHASLNVVYASAVAKEIPTDPPTIADEGMKWLFVKMGITNTGDEDYNITGGPFVVEIEENIYGIVSGKQEWEVRGRTIEPNETISGWIVYQIPRSATSGTLIIREDISRKYSVIFQRDTSMKTTLPE